MNDVFLISDEDLGSEGKTTPVALSPESSSSQAAQSESSDYTDDYIMDPDDVEGWKRYEEGGVSFRFLHGVVYTPPGFKRVRRKRMRTELEDDAKPDQEP